MKEHNKLSGFLMNCIENVLQDNDFDKKDFEPYVRSLQKTNLKEENDLMSERRARIHRL